MASTNYTQHVGTFQAWSPDNRLSEAETRAQKNVKALSQLHCNCKGMITLLDGCCFVTGRHASTQRHAWLHSLSCDTLHPQVARQSARIHAQRSEQWSGGHTSILTYCSVICASLTDYCFYRSCFCCYRTLRREKCLVRVGNRTTQVHDHQVCSLATIPSELPRLQLLYRTRTVDILRRIIVLWSCGGVVGWGTALQGGRSRVRVPMVPFAFFIDVIFSAALWPWGRPRLWQKWLPWIFPGSKGGRWLGSDNLTTLMCRLSWNLEASVRVQVCTGFFNNRALRD